MILLLIHVDNILITRYDKRVLQKLGAKFSLKSLGSVSYFLEFKAHMHISSLYLLQMKYINDFFYQSVNEQLQAYYFPNKLLQQVVKVSRKFISQSHLVLKHSGSPLVFPEHKAWHLFHC